MTLRLSCSFAEVDDYGKIRKEELPDSSAIEMLDGMEIEGFRFEISERDGEAIVIVHGDTSDQITPNYMGRPGSSVLQIGFSKDAGRKTANVVNMFLRRASKLLTKHCGREMALLIKEVAAEDKKSL